MGVNGLTEADGLSDCFFYFQFSFLAKSRAEFYSSIH